MHTVQLVDPWTNKLEIGCKSLSHKPFEFHTIWSLLAYVDGEELDSQTCVRGRPLLNSHSLGDKESRNRSQKLDYPLPLFRHSHTLSKKYFKLHWSVRMKNCFPRR
jgi:hypothetical protein